MAGRKSTAKKEVTIEDVRNAIRDTSGNISLACRKLKIARTAFYVKWCIDYPDLPDFVDDCRRQLNDEIYEAAQKSLIDLIKDKHPTAVIFALQGNPVGKRAGWGNKLELAGDSEQPVRIVVEFEDAERPDD